MGLFTDVSEIKRIARITNQLDDGEIGSYIDDVENYIIEEYGYYPGKMYSNINTDFGGSYFLQRNRKPVHAIKQVFLDGSELPEGSYTSVPGSGMILLASGLDTTFDGKLISIKFIPQIYHNLASWTTAKDVLQSQYLISSEGAENARVSTFNENIKRAEKALNQEVFYSPSKYVKWNPEMGVFVDQIGLGNNI